MCKCVYAAFRLVLVVGLFYFFEMGTAQAQPELSSSESSQIPDGIEWKEVATAAQVKVLELLSAHTKSNYQRITTWSADYSVHSEEYWSPSFVSNSFRDRLPKESTAALIREAIATVRVSIEMASGRIFREYDTKTFRLLTTDNRRSIVIPGVQPIDNRSIVTSTEYVYFTPKFPPMTYAVLPDHPDAQQKRAARRFPRERAKGRESADLMDPRFFFHCSSPAMSWEELDMYASFLLGKEGMEKQKDLQQRFRIEEGDVDGEKAWYRIQLVISFPDDEVNVVTSIWSLSAGFNPVRLTFVEKSDVGETIMKERSWKWKKVNDIFVPSFVSERAHPREPGGIDTFKRVVELKECTLNKPLDKNQFDYTALGLGSGDLILDEIEKSVFVMRDGQPTRLAGFNEPYNLSQSLVRERTWSWLVSANVAVIVLVLVLAWRRRFKRTLT